MKEILKNISEKHSCQFEEYEGTYDLSFNIRNLPLKRITLTQEKTDFKLIAKCEFLWGTSTKPSFLSGNNPDKYQFSITCHLTDKLSIPDFHIMEHDFFRKLLFKRHLRIKSKAKKFTEALSKNTLIKAIFSYGKDAAEISPIIQGYTEKGMTTITINYQSFELNADILDLSIEFCNILDSRIEKN